jgi:hypothetical protein
MMTRLIAIKKTGARFFKGVFSFIPGKGPGRAFPLKKSLSRRDFVKFGTGIALAAFPLLGCGSAFSDKTDDSGGDNPGETLVPRISFEATFSKPMDRSSVEDAMSISPGTTTPLSHTFTWSENDTVLNYMTDVDDEAAYTVTIGATAKDLAGNFLDGNSDGTGGDAYSFVVNGVLG